MEYVEKYLNKVEKTQDYDFWTRTSSGFYKMKDPETFWKKFSKILLANNGKLDTII